MITRQAAAAMRARVQAPKHDCEDLPEEDELQLATVCCQNIR